jgi:DNA-binding transcriptional LysR family regulator
MVPPLLRDLRARLPHVTFRLSQDAAGHIADRVGAGTADLGIVGPRPAGDLAWLELVQEPIRLVVPARHALAGRSHVGLREVARDSFVLLKRQYGLRSVVDGLLGAAGITPRVAFEAEDVGTLLGLVSAGLGTTLAPPTPQTVAPHAGVNVITIDDAHAHRSLGVIWDPSRTRAPGVDACLRHLLAVGPGLAVEAAARRAG